MSKLFYTKQGRNTLVNLEDCLITYRNFSGRKSEFNRDGRRDFNVILTPDQADELQAQGFNVKRKFLNDGEDEFCHMNVLVSFNPDYPHLAPKIFRIIEGEKKMVQLREENVGILDTSNIVNVDLVITPRQWNANGKSGIKAYCNQMFVTVEEDAFTKKYGDYDLG